MFFAQSLEIKTPKPPTEFHEKNLTSFKKIEKRVGKGKKKREILDGPEEGGPGQGVQGRGSRAGGSRARATGFKNVASRTKLA